jgi:hypothetical protein
MTEEELASAARKEFRGGGAYLEEILQTSIVNVPLEERRNEAKKPLYLIRYE